MITIIFYYCTIALLTAIPFLLISKETILPSSLSGWLIVIGLACTLLLVFLLSAYSIRWLTSGFVSVAFVLEPILSAILAWIIFAEALDFWNFLAFPVILLGVYLATTSKSAIKNE